MFKRILLATFLLFNFQFAMAGDTGATTTPAFDITAALTQALADGAGIDQVVADALANGLDINAIVTALQAKGLGANAITFALVTAGQTPAAVVDAVVSKFDDTSATDLTNILITAQANLRVGTGDTGNTGNTTNTSASGSPLTTESIRQLLEESNSAA